MKTAEEYFEANEPHDPNCIISGQRVSKRRCIQLMEEYAKQNTLNRDKVMEILTSKAMDNTESLCTQCHSEEHNKKTEKT
jgi:hypothetical protein